LLLFISFSGYSQDCNCEKEFLYVKGFIEQNYAGFKDKQAQITKTAYDEMSRKFQSLSKSATENCLLLIAQYLDSFKDQHIQIGSRFDATKLDSNDISKRPLFKVSNQKLAALSRATGKEGIYVFRHDSSYKIAVIKDSTAVHDYVGVIINSKLPYWKAGQLKFEAKRVNDSLYKGILYMRNHMPKVEYFFFGKNRVGGDWLREGAVWEEANYDYTPVAAQQLSSKTLYLKIASFSPSNAKNIDSLLKAHEAALATTPNLVLDLRDNGGGSYFTYAPLLPYLYTQPVKSIGVDVLATESNINGWKVLLDDPEIPEQNKKSIAGIIANMEKQKGGLVNIVSDYVDSSYQPMPYPKKVVVLMNGGCASTTEQFLLFAKQSNKVILVGEPTQGTLDYSNMREANFSCMPYVLRYATTRSRRLDVGEGIDNVGIQPHILLTKNKNWIEEAQKIAEKE